VEAILLLWIQTDTEGVGAREVQLVAQVETEMWAEVAGGREKLKEMVGGGGGGAWWCWNSEGRGWGKEVNFRSDTDYAHLSASGQLGYSFFDILWDKLMQELMSAVVE
jgi:hypothetical protein